MAVFGDWWGENEEFVGDDLKMEEEDSVRSAMKIWFIFTIVGCSDRREREKALQI